MKLKNLIIYSIILVFLPFILSAQNNIANEKAGTNVIPLNQALNSDGSLKEGVNGSIDPTGYNIMADNNGKLIFKKGENNLSNKMNDNNNPDDVYWDDRFGYYSLNGNVNVILVIGNDIYVGGSFSMAGNEVVHNLAKWDGSKWSDVYGGVRFSDGPPPSAMKTKEIQKSLDYDGSVYTLAYANGKLYVGGNFMIAGYPSSNGILTNNIGVLNLSTGEWSSLGGGLGSNSYEKVNTICIKGNLIYAGGYFSKNGGHEPAVQENSSLVNYQNIAVWKDEQWMAVSAEDILITGNIVNSICAGDNNDIIVGGLYGRFGNNIYGNIARWDGNKWHRLDETTEFNNWDNIQVIYPINGKYYIGGGSLSVVQAKNLKSLSANNDPPPPLNGFLYSWSYGTNMVEINPPFSLSPVRCITSDNGNPVIGTFNPYSGLYGKNVSKDDKKTANSSVSNPFKFDGTNWIFYGSGIDGNCNAIAISGDDLFVGGSFPFAGMKYSPDFARWRKGSGSTNVVTSPNFLSFGDVVLGGNNVKEFTILNNGTTSVTINGFSMIGTDAAIFSRVSNPDSTTIPITVLPGMTYTMKLKFSPVSPGYKGAIYQLSYNAGEGNNLLNVSLSGRGIAAKMNLSTDNIQFGEGKIGQYSYQTLTINNSGVDVLTISNLLFTGANPDQFSLANGNVMFKMNSKSGNTLQSAANLASNPININPGGTITLTIAFNPTGTGNKTANLSIYHNDATLSIPFNVALAGTGVTTFARIGVKNQYIYRPNSGICYLGQPVDTTIVITNLASNDYLYIKSLNFEKQDNVFQLLDFAPLFIGPGQSFNLRVRFNPNRRAISVNYLHIVNESQNMPDAVVQLMGTVYQPSLVISPDTSIIDFGTTSRDLVTIRKSIILQNYDPSRIIHLTGKNINGDTSSFRFINNNLYLSLAPGQSDTITFEFAPLLSGRKNVTFNISSDDPLGLERFILLTGVGGDAPVIYTSTNPVDFGELERQQVVDTVITISNIGNLLLNITKISIEGEAKDNYKILSGGGSAALRNGESLQLKVRFTGNIPVGEKNATIQILCNDPNNPTYKIELRTLLRSRILSIAPRIVFDSLEIGTYQDTLTTIKNTGNLVIRIIKINIDVSHPEDFSFTSIPLPFDLSPGEEKIIKLKFFPKEEGIHYTRLILTTTDPVSPEYAIVLRGTCIPIRKSILTINPQVLDFGVVEIDKKKELPLTLKNMGGFTLKIDSMVVFGDDSRHFSLVNANLPLMINSKDTQQILVRFAPVNDTSRTCTAKIRIYSNDENKPFYDCSLIGKILNPDYVFVYINDTTITSGSFELPVMVNDVTAKNVLSFQFTIKFDQTKFNAFEDIMKDGSILPGDWSLLANNKTPGQITIGAFGSSFLKGSGRLLKLKFNIISSAFNKLESVTNVIFTSKFQFTECVINSGKPSAYTEDASVLINRSGNGNFLCGDADVNGQVNVMDAAMTLRHSVGIENLTSDGLKNADVDKNGSINVFDASLILRHSIGLAMPSSVTTTCWASMNKNEKEHVSALSFNAINENLSNNQTKIKFSGFSVSDEVFGLSFDINLISSNTISLSTLSKDYMSVINKINPDKWRIAIINPTGINLKEVEVLFSTGVNLPDEVNISNIILNNRSFQDINLAGRKEIYINNYDLIGAYPNPFNPSTNIVYQLPETMNISMELYDIKGSKVRTLLNDIKEKGKYEIVWDGKDESGKTVSAGIYYCRMRAGSFLKTVSLHLIK